MRLPLTRSAIGLLTLALCLNSPARENTLLDTGWRFKLDDVAGAEQTAFDDSGWETLSLPHSWGWEEAQQGKTNYHRGPGWYRRDLNIGAPEAGKRYFLRFEAAGSVADVYLDGKPLGGHRGAFGAFCIEITKALSDTGTNVLAVRVNNAPQPDVAPLSGDFCVFGGLYRPVHLIETEDTCFALTDHASPGVAWLQANVTKARAVMEVSAEISNGTRRTQHLTLDADIFDATGKLVASSQQPIVLASNVTAPYWLKVEVPKPHLWNGRKDPYLYKAMVELRSTNGVRDSVEESLGLRSYYIDPDKGFFLNGKKYDLHGVDRHQDRPNEGWAISEAEQDEDIALLKELGATVIRCSHYQHSDYFYSLCDKAGILVWAEIPQVNQIGATPQFAETSRNQLLDLIRQNINHPSIFVWSLFNEIRAGGVDPHRELQDLRVVARGEDPTRPTIAATMTPAMPEMNKIPDQLGWNLYPDWYGAHGAMTNFGDKLDSYRLTSRSGGFCVSEYGAGANATQHEQDPSQPAPGGQWHPEEWQALVHEQAWPILKSRPFVWAAFVWNLADFTSAGRHEGGVSGRNDKGLVTYDRKVKKDAFYFYKANWSDEPVLYITSRRFFERTNAVTDVKVYSNAKKVEMLVNGISLGTPKEDHDDVFVWKNVQLKPGVNQIEAKARRNGQEMKDSCEWTLQAAAKPGE